MSAARRSSSTARRTLLTATAAGTLLGALWFVPSANATPEAPARQTAVSTRTSAEESTTRNATTTDATDTGFAQTATSADGTATDGTATQTQLADTGSVDTTPYVVGGALFLCLGAGFVTYSVRRERMEVC
ncbi:hypothetical protein ABZ876_02310 [Streptomyces sp. NPDC046931]|uniref:hypothetical protein n=1 Tax=Streptomyces sp. NPDC046931 TaxID=3154806 RepID=UPI00340E5147